MRTSGDTMELTPNRGPMRIPSKTPDECIVAVRSILQAADIDAIAVELPMQRHQKHDDAKVEVATVWSCGSLEAVRREGKEAPRVRYEPVGATVIIRDGKSTPWVLIDPAYLENPVVRDLLQKASARWTPEVLARIREAMKEEGEEERRKALEQDVAEAMKEDHQRSRGRTSKVYDPVKKFGKYQKGKKLSGLDAYWLKWCQSQHPEIIYRNVNWTRLSAWELKRRGVIPGGEGDPEAEAQDRADRDRAQLLEHHT